MWRVPITRTLHIVLGLYLVACAIDIADQAGLAGEQSAVAVTAEELRELRSTDLSGSFEDVGAVLDGLEKLAGSFGEVTRALE